MQEVQDILILLGIGLFVLIAMGWYFDYESKK